MGSIVEHKLQQLRTFRVLSPEATGVVFRVGRKSLQRSPMLMRAGLR
jgi:hypothetical protein